MTRLSKLIVMGAALTAPMSLGAQEEPRAVVEALFRAMKAGDADAMAALMHAEARLVTTSIGEAGPTARTVPVARWLESVRGAERELDERIHDVVVHRDQGLAAVWTAYDLFVDGTLSHCGYDAFHLVLTAEGWRILEIVDTRRTEGCTGS